MNKDTYMVNTIYPAFMGECNKFGIGTPCTFLRLNGCNIRCYKYTMGHLCDAPEALDVGKGTEMSVSEIIDKVKSFGQSLVCLTGGEPLLQIPLSLLYALDSEKFSVVVETNGTIDISRFRISNNITFVVDKKDASTGESHKFNMRNLTSMSEEDYLKFVINDRADFEEVVKLIEDYHNKYGEAPKFTIALGVFWGSDITYDELIKMVLGFEHNFDKLKIVFNMQAHKMMMLYDRERKNLSDLFIPREL